MCVRVGVLMSVAEERGVFVCLSHRVVTYHMNFNRRDREVVVDKQCTVAEVQQKLGQSHRAPQGSASPLDDFLVHAGTQEVAGVEVSAHFRRLKESMPHATMRPRVQASP